MTHHAAQDYLQRRNSQRLAQWHWRWCQQSGTYFTRARDLQDLRDTTALLQWRRLQFELFMRRAELERAQGRRLVRAGVARCAGTASTTGLGKYSSGVAS